jgi:16S rRNA (cytosine967-C5)-methyltransferase
MSAPITPARTAAFNILQKVALGRGHSDDLLHTMAINALSAEDRNLTTALVLGTLRWQLALDAIIRPYLQRPFQEMPAPVLLALRLGIFQLLLLDRIPAHAALNENVELARANGQPQAAGMVNAVLRRVQRESEVLKKKLTPQAAHPQWLVDRWSQTYGKPDTQRIVEADQQEPNTSSLFLNTDGPQMDDGSRLVAELAAISTTEPRRILDCCAAPGGKTLVLAARHPQAKIIAADLSPKRLASMQRRIERDGVTNVETVLADLTTPQRSGPFEKPFDLILCDVPCSGTGTLARNPEIRQTLRPEDLPRQAQRQRAILAAALPLLAPGGRIVYSTCSLEIEENEDIVRAATSQQKDLRQVDVAPLLTRLGSTEQLKPEAAAMLRETAVRGATLRTLPGVHPTDGFFAAVFAREG